MSTPGRTRTAGPMGRPLRADRILLAILGGGLLIRLLHFWTLSDTAFPRIPLIFSESDMYAFLQWARAILAGDVLGRDTYHPHFDWMAAMAPPETWHRWWGGKEIFQQAPFYPYWLAALLRVSGESLPFVLFFQLLVGALQPLVIFCLARRLFDPQAGLAAAALTAFYGPFIFHQGTLLRDWLPPIVEPLALVALLRAREAARPAEWLLAGGLLGLAILIKETVLLFLPVVLLWLVLEYRGALRQVATGAALVGLGCLLALGPLVARNAVVGAPLFATSNRAAEGFIEGNAADGFPVGTVHPPSMKRILEESDARVARVAKKTLETYEGDWVRFLEHQLLKLRALGDPLEVPSNLSFYYGIDISPVLSLTLRYEMVLPLGLAGFLLSVGLWRRHRLLGLYGASVVAGLMVVNIVGRYRLVLVPVLIIYGAFALAWLVRTVRAGQALRAVAGGGLALALALGQHFVVAVPALRSPGGFAVSAAEHSLSARIYAAEGRFDRALAEIERVQARVKGNPGFAPLAAEAWLHEGSLRVMWARRLLERGQRAEARRQVELAAAAYGHHPQLSYPRYYLGQLYLGLGEGERARAEFERFLELESAGPRADAVRRALERKETVPPLAR